ncbi:MAG: amidohydrolase [Proteobacteria bacterium]|nr:amidohydrolase [Pseudomonadota bacterium]
MEMSLSGGRTQTIESFRTAELLRHARQQAVARRYADFPIVDVDSHHYETDAVSAAEIIEYINDPVLKQLALSASQVGAKNANGSKGLGILPSGIAYQDMGGRVTRYPLRGFEETDGKEHRDIALTKRWMDAMGIDLTILFPTMMLDLGFHPQVQVEVELAQAYNKWLVERLLAVEPRFRSMLYLPFNDPEACVRTIEEFGDKKGVIGFLVTSARMKPVHDNAYARIYAMLEERGLPIGFHGNYNWGDVSFSTMNRFISVHSIGFVFYNMVHMVNWIMNGLPERFPKLKVMWIESGLAWVPFMIQRLDNEYKMRTSEAPALKKLPGDYIRDMYFSSQPMEKPDDLRILETTFRMINAETQLMYSSDYPHWDFDLPSVIYDLPFLSESAKRAILGGNAIKLFNLGTVPKMAKI